MTIIAAFLLDLALGDPARLPHPVRLMGRFAAWLETVLRPRRPNQIAGAARSETTERPDPQGELVRGVVLAAGVVGVSCGGAVLIEKAGAALNPWLGWAASAWLTYTTIACRGLRDAALAVHASLDSGDIDLARKQTAMIVGRDTARLDEREIVRAVVETVAENLVDAVVSPLFFAALAGAPAAVAYRAVNTLDSMVGYRNQRYLYFGRASARLDDVANYLPARIGARLIAFSALLTGRDWRGALRVLRRDAGKHPSPNSGLPEAAFAGALGVRLGGLNYYGGEPHFRMYMGDPGSPFEPGLIRAATALMYAASVTAAAIAAAAEVIRNGWHGIP